MKLAINGGEYEFKHSKVAVFILEKEFGYEGQAWEMVKASSDLDTLCTFLIDDGVDAVLID